MCVKIERRILALESDKWRLSFALWSGERPVAYAVLSRKAPDQAHLHHFMVARNFRGRGLGKRMIAEMEARARDGGYHRLTLKVAQGNDGARRFYGRHGYAETARESSYLLLEKAL
jgi:ribosomal protein S18 acetylase RimI-like enzyme